MDEEQGLWAVVITPGGKFLGNFHGNFQDDEMHEPTITGIEQEWASGVALALHESYEYMSGIVPMGNGQVSKNAIALPIGAAMHGVSMMVKPCAIIFFDHMEKEDREKHFGLVKKAREASKNSVPGGSNIVRPGFGGFGPPGSVPGRG